MNDTSPKANSIRNNVFIPIGRDYCLHHTNVTL